MAACGGLLDRLHGYDALCEFVCCIFLDLDLWCY